MKQWFKKIMFLKMSVVLGIFLIAVVLFGLNKNNLSAQNKEEGAKEDFEAGFVQDIGDYRKTPEIIMKVDENIIFEPGPLQQNKDLMERGDVDIKDLGTLGKVDEEDEEGLIGVSKKVKRDPTNPIFLSESGQMAGTGDTTIALASAVARVGAGPHPKALEVAGLALDEFGLVNWADAIRKGKIAPIAGLTPQKRASENYEEYIIVFKSMSDYMADVVFPHDIHTYWLDCSNCHRKIFIDKAGANPVTMKKVVAGEYCGRCHGKVAFPLESCARCHVKPKGGGAITQYPEYNAPIEVFPETKVK